MEDESWDTNLSGKTSFCCGGSGGETSCGTAAAAGAEVATVLGDTFLGGGEGKDGGEELFGTKESGNTSLLSGVGSGEDSELSREPVSLVSTLLDSERVMAESDEVLWRGEWWPEFLLLFVVRLIGVRLGKVRGVLVERGAGGFEGWGGEGGGEGCGDGVGTGDSREIVGTSTTFPASQ